MIVSVGLTNTHHEPINFFGTSRPEGETSILSLTWHETGIEFYGTFGRRCSRFSYQAFIAVGLNLNGFDRDIWVAGDKRGLFETDNFTSPAYVGRLNYEGVPGLRIGGSVYYCAGNINIEALLEEAGSRLADLAQMIVYLRDISDYPGFDGTTISRCP